MAREYVPIFFDWLEVTQDLTQEQKGNLIDAAILYASGGDYNSVLTGVERIAFRFIKGQIDRNNAISDARSKAGSIKWKQNETNDIKEEQTITNDIKCEQMISSSLKEKEKEKEKENKKEVVRRFTPPTPEEVAEYCRERGNSVNADRFVDFYSSKGWKVGNQPMKDWKAAVRTWEQKDKPVGTPVAATAAQGYKQRDYSAEQDEAFRRMMEMEVS